MRSLLAFLLATAIAGPAFAQQNANDLVLVEGGTFKNTKSNYFGKPQIQNFYLGRMVTIPSIYVGKYPVTQRQWTEVMGSNPSKFKGDNLPVEMVSWYDCVEYCNKRSLKEGLKPCYAIDKANKDPNNGNQIDDVKWAVTINAGANGYRLPTEAEWEYAADGGKLSKSYTYSGSDDVDKVAWYWTNSGDKPLSGFWSWPAIEQNHGKTHAVGSKEPNELGLYDMSGNVREWCWNWYGDSTSNDTEPQASAAGRVWRGGGWLGGDFCCATTYRAAYEASGKGPDQGFRVFRDR